MRLAVSSATTSRTRREAPRTPVRLPTRTASGARQSFFHAPLSRSLGAQAPDILRRLSVCPPGVRAMQYISSCLARGRVPLATASATIRTRVFRIQMIG